MTSTHMRVLPGAAGRVRILLVYLLTIGSAVVVFPCGVAMYFMFHTMPKAEQVKLPAVMPWEVYEIEPWLVVVGYIYVTCILFACVAYAVWGTRAFLRAWQGRPDVDLYARASGRALLIFWVLAVVSFFFGISLSFGCFGGISYGMD